MKIVARIMEVAALLFLIFWLMTVIVDFSNARKENKPIFCLRTKLYEYDDGVVQECLGMGYKVFTYKRDAINGVDFVPSWKQPKKNIE